MRRTLSRFGDFFNAAKLVMSMTFAARMTSRTLGSQEPKPDRVVWPGAEFEHVLFITYR